jgi:hypothetical protein
MSRSRQFNALSFVRKELAEGRSFPSIARIAAELGCADSGARDCVDRMLLGGHIERTTVQQFGNGIRSSYTLRSSKLADGARRPRKDARVTNRPSYTSEPDTSTKPN